MWIQIILALLPLLQALLDWIMKAKRLTERQQRKVEHIIHVSRLIEGRATELGCVRGGRRDPEPYGDLA